MTLRHLTVFLTVCDEGNMTAAADKLHIAQPSVSQTIAELEKNYQVRLFERLGRKLFLTLAGRKLLTYARHIVNLSKEAEAAMQEIHQHGSLRIGASVTIGTCILSNLIVAFRQSNAGVKVLSSVNNTRIIEEMLLADQLDLGLVEGRVHSNELLCIPFMDDELAVVSAAAHPLARKRQVSSWDLEGVEFIVREEGSGTRELFESVMHSSGIAWQVYGVYNNAETIKAGVAAGLGITVMSKLAVQNEVNHHQLAIIPVKGLDFKRQFCMTYHKNKYITPVMEQFMALCRRFDD